MEATGSWPMPVSVVRKWAEAVGQFPPEAALTTLSVVDGKLWARDFGTNCTVGLDCLEEEEELANKQRIIAGAREALAHYNVSEEEIAELIESADRNKGALWGADEIRLRDDIALAWKYLVSYGVEPSEIRRLLDRKSRGLWNNPPQRR